MFPTHRANGRIESVMREFNRFMRQLGRAIEDGIELGIKLFVLVFVVIVALAMFANLP